MIDDIFAKLHVPVEIRGPIYEIEVVQVDFTKTREYTIKYTIVVWKFNFRGGAKMQNFMFLLIFS